MDINNLWIVAVLGALTSVWSYVKQLQGLLFALVFRKIQFDPGSQQWQYIYWYLVHHTKVVVRDDIYTTPIFRVLKNGSSASVLFDMFPQRGLFIANKHPIFITGTVDNGLRTYVYTFRWFDIMKFMRDACDVASAYFTTLHTGIQYHFGSRGRRENHNQEVRYEDIIWTMPLSHSWEEIGLTTGRAPFTSLHYQSNVLDLATAITHWVTNKSWYQEREIPWRMGCLLYGLPGTGKSSFIRDISLQHNLRIHTFDLPSMTSENFRNSWNEIRQSTPCILLLEDIDRLFDDDTSFAADASMMTLPAVTLDVILNCLSGADNSDGVLVAITANDITKLDSALIRGGRLDYKVEFHALTDAARYAIATRILRGYDDLIEQAMMHKLPSGADFTTLCQHMAVTRLYSTMEHT